MGLMIPAALGAKLARPDLPMIGIGADGSTLQRALAEALRQGNSELISALLDELAWVGRFAAFLTVADGNGYYDAVAQLLSAFLEKAKQN